MKHKVAINVADADGHRTTVMKGAEKKLPTRLFRFLFGDFTLVYLLSPDKRSDPLISAKSGKEAKMTKKDVTKVAKAMINVADGMEVLGKSIRNCGKAILEITETVSEFIDLPKKALKENSVQNDLRGTKFMTRSKFMTTKIKSNEVGFKIYFMKVLIFMFVAIVKILDVQVIQNGSILRTALIFFYIFNEGIILLANAKNIGLPFLAKLKTRLKQLHDKSGGEDKDA